MKIQTHQLLDYSNKIIPSISDGMSSRGYTYNNNKWMSRIATADPQSILIIIFDY
jgi:hypothetical protein